MHGSWTRSFGEDEVVRIVSDMKRCGYATLPNFLSPYDLGPVRNVAQMMVRESGGEHTYRVGPQAFTGTVLAALPESPAFQALCRRLYELETRRSAPEVRFYQVFRCLQGSSGQKHSYRFHYDSHILTVLLPIVIPRQGASGDLIMIPNMRRVRTSYATHVIDKFLLENAASRFALATIARRGKLQTFGIRLQPGSAYFFWGYRALHANAPCDRDKLRATALLHYADPHGTSRTKAFLNNARGLLRGRKSGGRGVAA